MFDRAKYMRVYNAAYRKKHAKTLAEAKRVWTSNDRRASPEKYRLKKREYKIKHAVGYRAATKRYLRRPEVRFRFNLRHRIWLALRGLSRSVRTLSLLGCSLEFLKAHLESKFRPGMTWGNYGPVWHVDHKRPCASFDLTDPAQQRACFSWKNLQPLFKEENMRKGDRPWK